MLLVGSRRADNESFSPPLLGGDSWVVAVFPLFQLDLRVNGLKVLEEARVGRKVSIEEEKVKVVAARGLGVVVLLGLGLGVVVLLGLPAGSRLSVKEKGNKLGEGGAVAWWSISTISQ